MEPVQEHQSIDNAYINYFLGALRGTQPDGREVGCITEVYAEEIEFSHKSFECKMMEVVKILNTEGFQFTDPEVWKTHTPEEAFAKRHYIVETYADENRELKYLNLLNNTWRNG
ncbi:MAG: hypothetical protein HC880_17300 [Bacteroidia bacterium]|nr:hypothetical protein [Bacteroidia bacterium]